MSNSPNSDSAGAAGTLEAAIPRYHLPDDWSGKGACPVCRTPGQLRVQHQDVSPDRMVCGACGTAFEVEAGGTRIRLAVASPAFGNLASAGLVDVWLSPAELRAAIDKAPPLVLPSPFEEPTPSTAPAPAETSTPAPTAPAQPEAPVPTPSTPPTAKAANGSADEPDGVPGSEDWFASLAAVIGGLRPITPPPDAVLADELERALAARSEPSANGAAERPLEAVATNRASTAPLMTPETLPLPGAKITDNAEIQSALTQTAEMVADTRAPERAASLDVPARQTANGPGVTGVMLAAFAPELMIPPEAALSTKAPEPLASEQIVTAEQAQAHQAAEVQTALVPANPVKLAPPKPPPATRRELSERAWKLHELGNSLASIQGTLESLGGTPDDVGLIMSKLVALEQARQARFRLNLVRAGGAAGIVLFVLLVVVALLSRSPAPTATPSPIASPASSQAAAAATSVAATSAIAAQNGTSAPGQATAGPTLAYNPLIALLNQVLPGDVKLANGPSPTPVATSPVLGGLFPATPTLSPADLATQAHNSNNLPPWVSTLIPPGVTVLNVPTPSVDTNGPPAGPCPTSAAQAAALFGGPAASWSFNHEQQGWIFILADSPTIIRVPAQMTAGYLVLGSSLEMRSAQGPATLHNVNFVAITCN